MSFLDGYKNKVSIYGNNVRERTQYQLQQQFKQYLKYSPTVHKITINNDNTEYLADIQDVSTINQNNNDEKYCIVETSTPLKLGDYISWKNKYWIVSEEENNSLGGKLQFKIRPSNYTLKWINKNGNLISYPCLAVNVTMYSVGVFKTNTMSIPDGKLQITLPYNNDTMSIKRDTRFLFHNEPYKVTFLDLAQIDKANNKGLISFILKEDVLRDTDDLVNGIADNSIELKDDIQNDTTNNGGVDTIVITGNSTLKEFYTEQYTAKLMNNDIEVPTQFDFTIDYNGNSTSIASLNVIDDNTCELIANQNAIYGTINLVVTDRNNTSNTNSMEIKIISLW